jgi:hypothetical protein
MHEGNVKRTRNTIGNAVEDSPLERHRSKWVNIKMVLQENEYVCVRTAWMHLAQGRAHV